MIGTSLGFLRNAAYLKSGKGSLLIRPGMENISKQSPNQTDILNKNVGGTIYEVFILGIHGPDADSIYVG